MPFHYVIQNNPQQYPTSPEGIETITYIWCSVLPVVQSNRNDYYTVVPIQYSVELKLLARFQSIGKTYSMRNELCSRRVVHVAPVAYLGFNRATRMRRQ
jgi:hypothetical protein